MQAVSLKEYLGIALDMEESIFLQEKMAAQIESELQKLQQPQIFTDPAIPHCPQKTDDRLSKKLGQVIMLIGICFVTWFLAAAIMMIVIALFKIPDTILLLSLIPPIYYIWEYVNGMITVRNKYNDDLANYKGQMKEYHKEVNRNKIQRAKENKSRAVKIAVLQSVLSQIHSGLETSKGRLQTIYSKNILFPKYRNLIALSSLYEYICTGRCYSLEGHAGGYNIYENEVLLHAIITKMDEVVTNLEMVRQNQSALYSAVQDINKKSKLIFESTQSMGRQLQGLSGQADSIAERISELQKASALTEYYAERTQKELSYMNRMDYLTGRNDGIIFNLPPI